MTRTQMLIEARNRVISLRGQMQRNLVVVPRSVESEIERVEMLMREALSPSSTLAELDDWDETARVALEAISRLGADATGSIGLSCHWHHEAAALAREALEALR